MPLSARYKNAKYDDDSGNLPKQNLMGENPWQK